MNLCKRPIYQKARESRPRRKKGNRPTAAQIVRREKVRALGCCVRTEKCKGYTQIHHAGTGAGGRKDHEKIMPLCVHHHQGDEGINGSKISRREWEQRFGQEDFHLQLVAIKLGEVPNDNCQ